MDEPTNKDTSEFNAGISLLLQLDEIEKSIINATAPVDPKTGLPRNIDYTEYYRNINSYFKTLYAEMNTEEKTKQKENQLKVKECLNQILKRLYSELPIPFDLVEPFEKWELELREIKKRLGMGMPKKEDDYGTPALIRGARSNYKRY